jgi:hypothetical protein
MRILLITLAAFVLGGCAVGRTASYSDASLNLSAPTVSQVALAVAVQDRRPYVLSGNKPEKFVGLMRGGFGNPFDVNTASGGPLANEVRNSLQKALAAKGYNVSPVTIEPKDSREVALRKVADARAKRAVVVTLTEFKSDAMMRSEILYDMTLVVLDERGNTLATNTVKGNDITGYAGLSPEEGIIAAMSKKLEALFDDPKVTSALRTS